jgi:hypothetical protein
MGMWNHGESSFMFQGARPKNMMADKANARTLRPQNGEILLARNSPKSVWTKKLVYPKICTPVMG